MSTDHDDGYRSGDGEDRRSPPGEGRSEGRPGAGVSSRWSASARSSISGTAAIAVLLLTPAAGAQTPPALAAAAANLTVPAAASQLSADVLLDPVGLAWQHSSARLLALNRTPPLYDTDPPAESEIPAAEVRVIRSGGELLINLSWRDDTPDRAEITPTPGAPPAQRRMKELTAATDRFFDAAAVMVPANVSTGIASPSLQMGDANDPVTIYYWNAARGAMLMEAQGRGTTKRTGRSFPAQAVYREGKWHVAMELPELPAGVPMAFAVWNGSQLDRDGRKYFSVWYRLE
jgi:hypothetical protein